MTSRRLLARAELVEVLEHLRLALEDLERGKLIAPPGAITRIEASISTIELLLGGKVKPPV